MEGLNPPLLPLLTACTEHCITFSFTLAEGIDNCNRIAKSPRKPAVSISPPIILFNFFLSKIYMKGEVRYDLANLN